MAVDFERQVYCLLGLPFDAIDLEGAVRLVREAAIERKRLFFSTANLNFLVSCQTDSQFRDSVINSDLSSADGAPLVWIARALDIPVRERVAGSDLFDRLGTNASSPISVFFFGGADGAAEAACRKLNENSSGLSCAGFECPGFGSVEDMSSDATIEKINASGADFVVVSLGARKGQAWIERNRERLSAPVISHLGAVLNFVAGTVHRAPVWMRSSGLEWLWRIKEEPLLWRRYFADGLALFHLFLTCVIPYSWFLRRRRVDAAQLAAAAAQAGNEGDDHVIRLRGAWNRSNLACLRQCFSQAAASGRDVILEMAEVTYVDAAFLGLAILLQGHQKRSGRRLRMVSLQQPVRRIMKYCQAEYLCSDTV